MWTSNMCAVCLCIWQVKRIKHNNNVEWLASRCIALTPVRVLSTTYLSLRCIQFQYTWQQIPACTVRLFAMCAFGRSRSSERKQKHEKTPRITFISFLDWLTQIRWHRHILLCHSSSALVNLFVAICICLCCDVCAALCLIVVAHCVCFCTNSKSVNRFSISWQLFISAFSSFLRARSIRCEWQSCHCCWRCFHYGSLPRAKLKIVFLSFSKLIFFSSFLWISHRYASISINTHAIRKMAEFDDRRKCARDEFDLSKSM